MNIIQPSNFVGMTDILLDENNDMAIVDGDFVIGRSDEQNQHLIIASNKGEWKAHPEVGVGIQNMLNSDEYTEILIEIKKQLQYDGMLIKNVSYGNDGKLIVDGEYR